MNMRGRRIFAGLAMLALVTAVLVLILRVPLARLDVPYSFTGDAVDKLAQIHNVAETGWLFHSDRLGYPFGYDRLDFPRFDSLNYAIMGPVAALTGQSGLAMNLYFIAGFYLVGFTALFAFRQLGLGVGPALLCALLYSFLPYHVQRGVGHLTNGAYYLVPLGILALVWVAQNRLAPDLPGARWRWGTAIATAALLPLQTPYNGVFFAFLCACVGAIVVSGRTSFRAGVPALVLLGVTSGTFILEQLPSIAHTIRIGANPHVADRLAWEAELYSLRLHQILLPHAGHPLQVLSDLKSGFDYAMQVPQFEFRNQYLGFLGVLGLGALFVSLARACVRNGDRLDAQATELEKTVRMAALLAIAVLLLAMSSGLGTIVSHFITNKIRAYNRILPFLAFPCLLGAGWMLQESVQRIGNRTAGKVLLVVVGAVALLDSSTPMPKGNRPQVVARHDLARTYFAAVEERLGAGAAIFQIPAVWYPEHPPINRMADYDEFMPFLFTRDLRMSYGGARGRPGYAWSKAVARMPASEMIAEAHRMGFSAILVDGNGYATNESRDEVVRTIGKALPTPPLVSPDQRWWLFPIEGCCGTLAVASHGVLPAVPYPLDGSTLSFARGERGPMYLTAGWADSEDWGTWSLGSNARIRMLLPALETGAMTLVLDVRMPLGPKLVERHLVVSANGHQIGDVAFTLANEIQQARFDLPTGLVRDDGVLEIGFQVDPVTSPRWIGINEDDRLLGVGLESLVLTRSGPAPPSI